MTTTHLSIHRSRQWLTLPAVILVIATLGSPPSRLPAQQATPVPEQVLFYNRPDVGQIGDTNLEGNWHFIADAKDRISITVDRTDNTLVPRVELRSEKEPDKLLASAEKDTTFARAIIREYSLTAPGEYVVTVGRYKGKDGKTSGKYKVTVALLGAGEDAETFQLIQGELKLGVTRKGSLTNPRWRDSWAVTVDTPGAYTITARRSSGTLVPILALLDAKQHPLSAAQADETFAAATISSYPFSAAGQYIIVISRDGGTNGATSGDYELTVTQDSSKP